MSHKRGETDTPFSHDVRTSCASFKARLIAVDRIVWSCAKRRRVSKVHMAVDTLWHLQAGVHVAPADKQ